MINSKKTFSVFLYIFIPVLFASLFLTVYYGESFASIPLFAVIGLQLYLLGSVPWGYIVYRIRTGRDIREYGSGKIGTSNMFRTSGKYIGFSVLILDCLKGGIAVLVTSNLIYNNWIMVLMWLLVVVGHNWSVFLGFKGGRGIAPALGSLLILTPVSAALALLVFLPVTFISKYLSLGSILGVVMAVVSAWILTALGWYTPTVSIYATIVGIMILFQHRDNMQRIMTRTERKIGQPAEKLTSE
ncbi:MAG: glycerol-3-phosphate 1-O-acyltransferase PlsY [SAR202 cluster bacterium]|nr:glycerol-3-phosphate 1-O-acyltransferase PlsY [SAR202 cluster bacterium]MQG87031.1 glycerol-3-phosphate 1-O-acyltransferase PlsY [SAR202 cluster bacterium]|tara:strand:- start:62721 stop:63449 length:729 start_codon:yes stop_codon:yes gene_type:complete